MITVNEFLFLHVKSICFLFGWTVSLCFQVDLKLLDSSNPLALTSWVLVLKDCTTTPDFLRVVWVFYLPQGRGEEQRGWRSLLPQIQHSAGGKLRDSYLHYRQGEQRKQWSVQFSQAQLHQLICHWDSSGIAWPTSQGLSSDSLGEHHTAKMEH